MSAEGLGREPATRLVQSLLDAWNAHDVDQLTRLYTSDYRGLDVSEAEPRLGPEGAQRAVSRFLKAFPDLQFTIDSTLSQDAGLALLWTAQGTHLGPWMNIPATGRPVSLRGVSWLTIREGRIAQDMCIWDVAGLLRHIGLLPEL